MLETITSFVRGSDRERLAKRQAVKKELEGLQSVEAQAKAIRLQLRQLAERETTANAVFDKASTKSRAEMEAVEGEISALILAGEPMPASLAKRRDTTLNALVSAQSVRDAEVAAIKRLRIDFARRASALDVQVSQLTATRGRLQGYDLADAELLALRFINRQRSIWAERRLREADRERQLCSERLAMLEREREAAKVTNSRGEVVREREPSEVETEAIRDYQFWAAEADAAKLEVESASEEKSEIQRQIIDE